MDKKIGVYREFTDKIGRALRRTTEDKDAHIHFHVKGKSHHIILCYSSGVLARIVAKSPECPKGEYISWTESEFGDLSQEEVILTFSDQIEKVAVDHPKFSKCWGSWGEFLDWLHEITG